MNCKNCVNNKCDLARVENDLNNDCDNFKLPKSQCPFCKKTFDKLKSKQYFKNTEMAYECPNCNKLIDSSKIRWYHEYNR